MTNTIQQFSEFNTQDVTDSLLWQYNDAPAIRYLVSAKEGFNQAGSLDFWAWYFFEYFAMSGLFVSPTPEKVTIWAILLGLPITSSPPTNLTKVQAFDTLAHAYPNNQNYYNANFGSTTGSTVNLPIEWAIFALRLRYFNLTGGMTIPQINSFMNFLMDYDGTNINANKIVLTDNHDMTITYKMNYVPNQFQTYIFNNLDLLPRPAGVMVNWQIIAPDAFGFGDGMQNFEHGIFGG